MAIPGAGTAIKKRLGEMQCLRWQYPGQARRVGNGVGDPLSAGLRLLPVHCLPVPGERILSGMIPPRSSFTLTTAASAPTATPCGSGSGEGVAYLV